MARLVSTQTGARRSRVRVIGRHVTVRHKLSDAFIQGVKNRRIQGLLASFGSLDGAFERSNLSHSNELNSEPNEAPAAPADRRKTTQLPRLGAYLDNVAEPTFSDQKAHLPPKPPRADDASLRQRGDRRPKRVSRSAYEELQAKWGRI